MKPIRTAETNLIYRAPAASDGIGNLPCARLTEHGDRGVWSVWELTPQERQQIMDGYNIRLGIIGQEPISPVSLAITHLTEVADGS